MNVDETSLRVDNKNHWIHVYSAGELTLKCLHRKRGIEAMKAIDVIPQYEGVLVHDCWSSYLSYESCQHSLCGSHLLRELTFIIESNGYEWAKQMKVLLKETAKAVSTLPNKILKTKDFETFASAYEDVLTLGEKELPEIPPKPKGKPGKIAKSDAHNLWERLKKHQVSVTRFAQDPHVPFTNNRAERDLRMSKVKQKVSGCFRTEQYAQAYCRVSCYLQTMANKGINPHIAVHRALNSDLDPGGGE